MDDTTFKIKNLEFHIKQKSIKYEECVSNALKLFLETKTDFDIAIVPCKGFEKDLNELMKEYERINANLNIK